MKLLDIIGSKILTRKTNQEVLILICLDIQNVTKYRLQYGAWDKDLHNDEFTIRSY